MKRYRQATNAYVNCNQPSLYKKEPIKQTEKKTIESIRFKSDEAN